MKKIIPQNLKGFRDFLPEDAAAKNRLISVIKGVFESFGFEPLETPALEYAETLKGKYGAEADKLLYAFEDRGGREVAMRYDLTVPLARVVAQYPELPKPFKRYQIAPVWRADKPQKGRYREFTQCDIDIVGSDSPLADAEIIAVLNEVFVKLGFKDVTIRVNSRAVLFDMMKRAGVPDDKRFTAIQSLDKLDKMSAEEVKEELIAKDFAPPTIKKIFEAMYEATPDAMLENVLARAKEMGVPDTRLVFDASLARGLDYYTGTIYEAMMAQSGMGSLAGGGRYDELIGMFAGTAMPACGVSFGIDRIAELLPAKDATRVLRVLLAPIGANVAREALALARTLRAEGIAIETYLEPDAKLEKQLKYADRKSITFAIIIGENELKKKIAIVRDLRARSQKEIPFADLANAVRGNG